MSKEIVKEFKKIRKYIKKNWSLIPASEKEDLYKEWKETFISGLDCREDHVVVLIIDRLLDRDGYEWDAERIGINSKGEVIWGFDSGCSCNGPWEDYPDCYELHRSRKVFKLKDFRPEDLMKDIRDRMKELKQKIPKREVV